MALDARRLGHSSYSLRKPLQSGYQYLCCLDCVYLELSGDALRLRGIVKPDSSLEALLNIVCPINYLGLYLSLYVEVL